MPVFGATLKAHFDAAGRLKVINGLIVPNIDLSVAPSWSQAEAEASAVGFVKPKKGGGMLAARNSRLLIYREGLAKGVPGENRLAYEVEVGNGINVREFVYVDAHTGKAIDRFSGTPDASTGVPTTRSAPRRRGPTIRQRRSGSKARRFARPAIAKPTT